MERRCPVSGEGSAPVYDADLFCDDFVRDPYPHYTAMRELGPVVWLTRHCNFAVTRYQEVKEALRNWQTFSAAQGVAADQIGCDFLRGNTLASDPPIHDTLRVAVAAPLLPGALQDIRGQIEQAANELIIGLTQKKSFDGIGDLARVLPLTIVTELVGLPEDGRENMLKWAGASFDILGVQNERGQRALETIKEMRQWITTRATSDRLKPGSWTWRIHELAKKGAITEAMAPLLIRDYINPSLDTTISAIGELIYQLGKNPNQWQLLRRDPTLVPNAVQEAVRLCAPIRTLSRTVVQDTELGGIALPASSRVMLLFASANRDQKKFPDPDRFDVTRPSRDHMSFGNGVHMCVGLHLARLEMESILNAMIPMVARIEVGEPTVAMNNTIRGFAMLPVTFDAAKDGPTPKGGSERNRLSALPL
jgi:cytochrome P450